MERTRRSAKVKAHAGFAELRRLREEGKTRLSTYEVKQEEDLYEEVDEEQYKKVVRDRLDQEDFVVDDGGEGYVDNGMDDWGDQGEGQYYSDEEEEEEDGKKLTGKELKRKREEDKERKTRQEGDIQKYFSRKDAPAVKAVKASAPTARDKEFLNDLLGEFDNSTSYSGLSSPMKKVKVEPSSSRRARKLSPPRKRIVARDYGKSAAAMRSSPPVLGDNESDYGDDITFPQITDDDDTLMSDAPIPPSSPAAKVAGRKLPLKNDDDDEDDDLEVAEIKGNKNVRTTRVNLTSSRPAKPVTLPTPDAPPKPSIIDSSAWTKVGGGLNVVASASVPEKTAFGKVQAQDAMEEDGSIKMFWTDYSEANGSLLLYGKVQDKRSGKYVSAFLKVDGILRNLLFLPRENKHRAGKETEEEVDMEDVYQEISDIMVKNRIEGFKTKPVSRKYAFELPGIPREGNYLKVLYPYTSRFSGGFVFWSEAYGK